MTAAASEPHKDETPKERRKRQIRNRLVYNDWGLYSLVQTHARHAVAEVGVSLYR